MIELLVCHRLCYMQLYIWQNEGQHHQRRCEQRQRDKEGKGSYRNKDERVKSTTHME